MVQGNWVYKAKTKVNESMGAMWLMGYAHAIPLKELREGSEGAFWKMSKLFWQIWAESTKRFCRNSYIMKSTWEEAVGTLKMQQTGKTNIKENKVAFCETCFALTEFVMS